MRKYRTVDYGLLNYFVKEKHLKYKLSKQHGITSLDNTHDRKLGHYILSHPNIFAKILTYPLSLSKAEMQGILWFVKELRPKYHVDAYIFKKPRMHFQFVFYQANQHSKQYWNNLYQDVCHSSIIPLYEEPSNFSKIIGNLFHSKKQTLIVYRFNLYHIFYNLITPMIRFQFVNDLSLQNLKRTQQLVYCKNNVKLHYILWNVYDLVKAHKLPITDIQWGRWIVICKVHKTFLYIHSQPLIQLIINQKHQEKSKKLKDK